MKCDVCARNGCGPFCGCIDCGVAGLVTAWRTIAANLAVAALGCAAYELGQAAGVEDALNPYRPNLDDVWRPGCGRAVDGWGGR